MKRLLILSALFVVGCAHNPDFRHLGADVGQDELEKHVRGASMVVAGTVIENNGIRKGYTADCFFKTGRVFHFGSDIGYYFVVVKVDPDGMLKGKMPKNREVLLVSVATGNRFEDWDLAPSFQVGQRGVWLLHEWRFKLQGTCGRAYLPDDSNELTVRDPLDSQPIGFLDQAMAILRAPKPHK